MNKISGYFSPAAQSLSSMVQKSSSKYVTWLSWPDTKDTFWGCEHSNSIFSPLKRNKSPWKRLHTFIVGVSQAERQTRKVTSVIRSHLNFVPRIVPRFALHKGIFRVSTPPLNSLTAPLRNTPERPDPMVYIILAFFIRQYAYATENRRNGVHGSCTLSCKLPDLNINFNLKRDNKLITKKY